jgi:monoamine oxidase
MNNQHPDHIVVIGAGASGLMIARELGRAGRRVTILEARNRCGGRICPLPTEQFGYPAEGGAEFVHGEAPVTRSLLREAGLSLLSVQGTQWTMQDGSFSRGRPDPHESQLHQALKELSADLPVEAFLRRYFAGPEYDRLRHSILRMVQGYDAADPSRASTLALRDEWMSGGRAEQARIVGGYRALIEFLTGECRRQGTQINMGIEVRAIESAGRQVLIRSVDGDGFVGDVAVVTAPLPLLREIALPWEAREKAAAAAHIGFGNVIKILLRFEKRWWTDIDGRDLSDMSFLLSDARIPVWWTQFPAERPVLTGWFGGPKTQAIAHLAEDELIEMGLTSLSDIFAMSTNDLRSMLVEAWARNWGNDPFSRGAYSYATPETRKAQSALSSSEESAVLFSGEALYSGPDMGTVEAALASGLETARGILASG